MNARASGDPGKFGRARAHPRYGSRAFCTLEQRSGPTALVAADGVYGLVDHRTVTLVKLAKEARLLGLLIARRGLLESSDHKRAHIDVLMTGVIHYQSGHVCTTAGIIALYSIFSTERPKQC